MTELLGPRPVTAPELLAPIEAERAGAPFLAYRDGAGEHRIFAPGDRTASRCQACTRSSSAAATTVSLNGSYVNGERVGGRRLLRDGDMMRFGRTVMLFRNPGPEAPATVASIGAVTASTLTEAQRRVLLVLCRPFRHATPFATAATNQQIADELHLSVEAIKTQNRKRLALVERALQSGVVSDRDL